MNNGKIETIIAQPQETIKPVFMPSKNVNGAKTAAFIKAMAALKAITAEVEKEIERHHNANRDVFVMRGGKLTTLSPPKQ